ncbi:MAG TPA: AAC(3) family N-acetyltransferase [Burkholderiales bacterium]|jgi:aminoglycoside 3-N-acetyltransferase|nr:AAC(3) family N-acetyltransferase [Burkholderiales bacterium]
MADLNLASFKSVFSQLGLSRRPVIAHAALKSFGHIQGGADTIVRALVECTGGVVMPTFTYKTMITPEVGPPHNAIKYGKDLDHNRLAEPFDSDNMPADPLMGMLPEALRHYPGARRTFHPILSFTGIRADSALDSQTLLNPLAPIGVLADQDGWALLLGVDNTVNTSIHYAEKQAGRQQFVRWGMTRERIVECPGFPGDSQGFEALAPHIEKDTRRVQMGRTVIRAVPLKRLFEAVISLLRKDSLALLCDRPDCERCNALREAA